MKLALLCKCIMKNEQYFVRKDSFDFVRQHKCVVSVYIVVTSKWNKI